MGSLNLQCLKSEFRTLVQHAYKRDLSAFVLWLDLKVAEFKVNGFMFLNDERTGGNKWLEFAECQQQVSRGQMQYPRHTEQVLPRRQNVPPRINQQQQMPHRMGAHSVDYGEDELEEIDMETMGETEYDGDYVESYEGEIIEGEDDECILLSSDEEADNAEKEEFLQPQGKSNVRTGLSQIGTARPVKGVTQVKGSAPTQGKAKPGSPGKSTKGKTGKQSSQSKKIIVAQTKPNAPKVESKLTGNGSQMPIESLQSANGSQAEDEKIGEECPVCHLLFETQQEVQNHVKEHKVMVKADDQSTRMMCPLCNKMFLHSSSFSRHMKMHQGFYSHICDTCGRKFTRKDVFMNHKCVSRNANVDLEYEEFEEEYLEEEPAGNQGVLSALQQAMQFGGTSMELQGALLGSGMTQPGKKKGQGRPMRPVMGPAMGPAMGKRLVGGTVYMCTTCNRTFSHQSSYNRHMNQHKGLYAHECGVCLRRFTRKDTFRAHKCRRSGEEMNMAIMNSPVDTKVAADLGCTPIPPTPPKVEPPSKRVKTDPFADGDDFDETMAAIDEAIANTKQVKIEGPAANLPAVEQKMTAMKNEESGKFKGSTSGGQMA